MSYVYMKALEKKAEKYDKGIRYLTLGRLPKIKRYISDNLICKNDTVLDIGMGTGTFLILCANKGAITIGIDNSEKMLEVAKRNINRVRDANKIGSIFSIFTEFHESITLFFSDDKFKKLNPIHWMYKKSRCFFSIFFV